MPGLQSSNASSECYANEVARPKPEIPNEMVSVRVPTDLLEQIDAVIDEESTNMARATRSSVILAFVREGLAARAKRSQSKRSR